MLRTRLSYVGQIALIQFVKLTKTTLNANLNALRATLPRLDTRDLVTGKRPVSIEQRFTRRKVTPIEQLTLAQRFRFVKGDPER
jgi:hypothetical protein